MGTARLSPFSRALRAPALHFAVLGMCLFLVQRSTRPDAASRYSREAIVIDSARIEQIRRLHAASAGSPPDAAAEAYMIDREIDDELLYREALAMGLDRADRTVFWRLVEKMKFLGEARDGESDRTLFERALAIGLHEEDPIVRRVLIRKLGMLVRFAADEPPPSEEELRAYYQRHAERYVRSERVTIVHAFFSRDRRGDRVLEAATRALEQLGEAGGDDAQAIELGDPFLSGHVLASHTRDGLAKLFGYDFASEVVDLEEGAWHGPIASAFGTHLVKVRGRLRAGRLPLDAVRSRVTASIEQERREARLHAKLTELRAMYEIRVERDGSQGAGDA